MPAIIDDNHKSTDPSIARHLNGAEGERYSYR